MYVRSGGRERVELRCTDQEMRRNLDWFIAMMTKHYRWWEQEQEQGQGQGQDGTLTTVGIEGGNSSSSDRERYYASLGAAIGGRGGSAWHKCENMGWLAAFDYLQYELQTLQSVGIEARIGTYVNLDTLVLLNGDWVFFYVAYIFIITCE